MKLENMTTNIETDRLLLRRPTREDTYILRDLWRNERVRQFLGGILCADRIEERIATHQKHWDDHGFGLYSVYLKATNDLVGICGLHHSEDGLEISYMFFPNHWGQGFAREAALACLNYGFTVLNAEFIISVTQEANQRSCHLLESMGMKLTRTLERFNELQRLYNLSREDYLISLKDSHFP
jgi:RimJ/RimL family protein N-acetyltransferase